MDFPQDTPTPDIAELSDDTVVERCPGFFQVTPYLQKEFTLDDMDLPVDTPIPENAELCDDAVVEICQKIFQVTPKRDQLNVV
ncbi:hypothetical protein BGX30_006734, partial [Mortierella sp. GBA39]